MGNLLVKEQLRGRGIGASLMAKSLETLRSAGVETIWLTASNAGKNLYLKLGFTMIDKIQRWLGWGGVVDSMPNGGFPFADVIAMDLAGWGDRREALIAATILGGGVYVNTLGFLVTQRWSAGMQVGPWGGGSPHAAAELLDTCLGQSGTSDRIFLDVPAGNDAAAALLERRDFAVKGETALMYHGVIPAYDPRQIFALASMGSFG